MPSHETLSRFTSLVQQGQFIEALQGYYAADAWTQENNGPRRNGLPALLEQERKTLAAHQSVRTRPVDLLLVEGDNVVVHWIFEFKTLDGRLFTLDELVWQRWQGERIVHERYFYDPAQLAAGKP